MSEKNSGPAQEFMYRDESGKRQDRALHEPILDAGDEAAAFAGSTYKLVKSWGWSEDEIAEMYGSLYRKAKSRGLLRRA